jgi:hypothetical protein
MRRTTFKFPITTLAGSTLENIRNIVENHYIEPKYRWKFLLTKIVAAIFELFNLAEKLIWGKRIREYRIQKPPVFIIGFWRNGTTLLHNLLCQDPEAAYVTTFHTVFPNLVLTQSWWLKRILNYFIPENRPYDNVSMDVDFPQEEDFGLMNLQPASIYKFFIFPAEFDRIVEEDLFTGKLPPSRVAQWKMAYRSMIAKAAFNTGGIRYIGKNPCHLARLDLLLEMFPDAKFIFIHRHPYKVTESLYHFILSIFPGVQLQDVSPAYTRETVVRLYKTMLETYLRQRDLIPKENLIELQLDEFVRDVPAQLQAIYKKFDLGDYRRAATGVEKYLAGNPAPDRKPHPPDQETIRLLDEQAQEIMKALGYPG